MFRKIISAVSIALALMLVQACAPASYIVDNPTPSTLKYDTSQDTSKKDVAINDKRPSDQSFSQGVLKANLTQNEQVIDPMAYLKTHTQAELNARGVAASVVSQSDTQVDVSKLMMRNYRANGYAPFITFTMLSADVQIDGRTERLSVYIKRGKVPVWSFTEIVQPTLNEPMDLLVKEFAAKLSARLSGAKIADGDVQNLISKINADLVNPLIYLDIYQLGFGNNASAIPFLVELSKSEAEYTRLAAISSLGILKAVDQLSSLQSIYTNSKVWQDRAMALKAIGDIGTQEAINFLQTTNQNLSADNSREGKWYKEVIALYI